MTIFFTQGKLLDPRKCWEDWIRLGSLAKVCREYTQEGTVNPNTGVSPNASAVQKSAYSYAVENIDVAKERFFFECRERGEVPTDDLWKEKLYKIGRLLYYQRRNRLDDFVKDNGLEVYAQDN